MEDQEETGQEPERVAGGRRAVVLIPALLILAGLIVYLLYPAQIYFFAVQDGQLTLYSGRSEWLGYEPDAALDPIPVQGEAVKALTENAYATRDAALADFALFIPGWIEAQRTEVLLMERNLEHAYRDLLKGLRGAKAAGVEGSGARIQAVERRLQALGSGCTQPQ